MAFPTSKTLKEFYTGDIVHTEISSDWGYHLQMWDAYENGAALVVANLTSLQTSIRTNAIKGQSKFTVTLDLTYQVANLKLNGAHLKSFMAGMQAALQAQAIYPYEYTLTLNIADSSSTKMDIAFAFGA
jgi:hypothetical protein